METTKENIDLILQKQEYQQTEIVELGHMINAIRMTMMTNLRFELNRMMDIAILRGYTTYDESTEITEKVFNYTALRGNHGIQEKFNEKFIKLEKK